ATGDGCRLRPKSWRQLLQEGVIASLVGRIPRRGRSVNVGKLSSRACPRPRPIARTAPPPPTHALRQSTRPQPRRITLHANQSAPSLARPVLGVPVRAGPRLGRVRGDLAIAGEHPGGARRDRQPRLLAWPRGWGRGAGPGVPG